MKRPSLYQVPILRILLGLFLFLIGHHLWGYYGHYGFDDVLGYGYYAKKWADGQLFFLNEDFFSYRWGFIAPTGFFYALFGVNDYVSAIFPTLVYLATALLVMRIMRLENTLVLLTAVMIYGLDYWTLYYSDKLMADTSVALATLLAFSAIARERFEASQSLPNALLLTSALFWGYLSKQSILLLFPAFGLLFIIDLIKGRYKRFWSYTIIACFLIGLMYLYWIYLLTGNPLERFVVVNQGMQDNLGAGRSFAFCNYSIQEPAVLYYRIFAEMGLRFLDTGMACSLLLALPTLLTQRWSDLWQTKTFTAYWSFAFLLSLLSTNFMTTSYQAYLPICPDIRHFLLLVPLAAVVAAPSVVSFAKTKEKGIYFLLSFGVGGGIAFCFVETYMRWLYLVMAAFVFLRLLLPNTAWGKWLFLVGLLGVNTVPALSAIHITHKYSAYMEQRSLIYKYFKNSKEKKIVITNQVACNIGRYLMEYEEQSNTQFYSYEQLPELVFSPKNSVYVLTSGDMLFRSRMPQEALPSIIKTCYEKDCPANVKTLYSSPKIKLLQILEPTTLLNE